MEKKSLKKRVFWSVVTAAAGYLANLLIRKAIKTQLDKNTKKKKVKKNTKKKVKKKAK